MVSITRPSRGERWSATTTRQTGFLRLPTRVSLTRTAKSQITSFARKRRRPTLATTRELRQRGHLAPGELAHHLLHLAELLDELVDRVDRGARALGDATPPRAVEQRRVRALLGRHRRDDRLDSVELALVDLQPGELSAHAGDHAQQ